MGSQIRQQGQLLSVILFETSVFQCFRILTNKQISVKHCLINFISKKSKTWFLNNLADMIQQQLYVTAEARLRIYFYKTLIDGWWLSPSIDLNYVLLQTSGNGQFSHTNLMYKSKSLVIDHPSSNTLTR